MANSISGWTEGILFTLVFVAVFTIIVVDMNINYSKNFNVPFADSQNTSSLFVNYQNVSQDKLSGGEVQFTLAGVQLKTSWELALDAVKIIWNFVSGDFLKNSIATLNLGLAGTLLGTSLQILWFLSLVWALLYVLFKVSM